MKNYKHRNKEIQSVVIPFITGDSANAVDGLFDDCPVCQEVREQIERGEVEEVVIDLDLGMRN